jgi:tetratricopeptide (TPR) repeat protein
MSHSAHLRVSGRTDCFRTGCGLSFKVGSLLVLLSCFSLQGICTPQTVKAQFEQLTAAGSEALQTGRYPEAEKEYRQALALDPHALPVLNNLAIAVARQGRPQEAIRLYQRALHEKPGDAITERNLGLAYFSAHQYQAALPLLVSFSKAAPNFQAVALCGIDLFALDRYAEAAPYLEQAHNLRPDDLETLNMLGKTWLRLKKYDKVTIVFNQIMAINPNSAEAHTMMAMAYDELYREADAIREFEAALAVDSRTPGAHTGLGLIYWRNDNLSAAAREFREALEQDPRDPIANCTLGRILRQQDKPALAVPYLRTAVAVNPRYKDALLALAQCRIALNQYGDAVQPLRRAIEIDPEDAEAHFILGTALNDSGHPRQGAQERSKAGALRAAAQHRAQITSEGHMSKQQ